MEIIDDQEFWLYGEKKYQESCWLELAEKYEVVEGLFISNGINKSSRQTKGQWVPASVYVVVKKPSCYSLQSSNTEPREIVTSDYSNDWYL